MKLVKLTSCGYCGQPIAMVFDPDDEDNIPSVSKQAGPCCREQSKWILIDTRFSYVGGLQYDAIYEHAARLAKLQEVTQ